MAQCNLRLSSVCVTHQTPLSDTILGNKYHHWLGRNESECAASEIQQLVEWHLGRVFSYEAFKPCAPTFDSCLFLIISGRKKIITLGHIRVS